MHIIQVMHITSLLFATAAAFFLVNNNFRKVSSIEIL